MSEPDPPVPRVQCSECLAINPPGSTAPAHRPRCSFHRPGSPPPPVRIVSTGPLLEAIKERARIRLLWPVGRIGSDQAWCRYCGALIPGEHIADRYRTPHPEHCPVLQAPIEPDFDALVAEVERLHGERA